MLKKDINRVKFKKLYSDMVFCISCNFELLAQNDDMFSSYLTDIFCFFVLREVGCVNKICAVERTSVWRRDDEIG